MSETERQQPVEPSEKSAQDTASEPLPEPPPPVDVDDVIVTEGVDTDTPEKL